MTIITKKQVIESVPSRWKHQYERYNTLLSNGKYSDDIYQTLLDTKLTEETIAEIIGNSGWTENICDECHEDKEFLVVLGGEDAEPPTRICQECLIKAILLIPNN